jgi:hypothetical protein
VSAGELSGDTLTPLQRLVLARLSPLQPKFTLTGGGALAGVHLGHRTTRDLDLFFRGRWQLTTEPGDAAALLHAAGLQVESLQAGPSFRRLRVSDGVSTCVVDMVADPVVPVSEPATHEIDGAPILVDSRHEILVNKLCALLSRSELRDLVDIRALLLAGGDLDAALADAPRKDGGFSLLTVIWLLRDWRVGALAREAGFSTAEALELERFHGEFLRALLALAGPA